MYRMALQHLLHTQVGIHGHSLTHTLTHSLTPCECKECT
jgi:hypothetical protein